MDFDARTSGPGARICFGKRRLQQSLAVMLCFCLLVLAATPVNAVKRPDLNGLQAAANAGQWEVLRDLADTAAASDMLTENEQAQALTYLALAQLNLEEPGKALDAADKAIRMDAANARGWLMRGTAYMMLRQIAPAEDDFNKALQLDHHMWEAARNLADAALATGDVGGALDHFEEAVAIAPQNADLGMEYGLLLHSLGLHAKADRVFTNIITVAEDSPALFNNRGMVRLALDRYNDALSDFSRAITLDPTYAEALVNRGNVLRAFKRYDDSLADFTTGIAAHPDSIKLLVGRAYTYSEMGRYADAAADMTAAYHLGNVDPYVLNEYAWFLATCPDASQRDGKRAVTLATEAIGLSPGQVPGYYDTLAAAYAEAGMFADAELTQREALEIGRRVALPESQLAAWEERLKGYEQGIPYRNTPQ